MIWATVSFQSWFCWLYRASLSLAAKNIINLILILIIWWCPCVESSIMLFCWKWVWAMTSAFSWQNSVSLWPASFCSPRPNLPVTPGISWLPTFASRVCFLKNHLQVFSIFLVVMQRKKSYFLFLKLRVHKAGYLFNFLFSSHFKKLFQSFGFLLNIKSVI